MKPIFVPRFMDRDNTNAQNLNARQLLASFKTNNWEAIYYSDPDQDLTQLKNIHLSKLLPGRFWPASLIRLYLAQYSAVFYPGKEWPDILGLKLRNLLRIQGMVISTIEGIMGGSERERILSDYFGHAVYCNSVEKSRLKNFDALYNCSDSIIAISPFLEKTAKLIYKKPVIYLPLGVQNTYYFRRNSFEQKIIMCVGSLNSNKNPQLFLKAATIFPKINFVWYGDGPLLNSLRQECIKKTINNVDFPGKVLAQELAVCYRRASLFVLPSFSEGAPKVLQEAAAASLPVISFGYYEPPSVLDKENGFIVWDEQDFLDAIDNLLSNDRLYRTMCKASYELSLDWEWFKVSPLWLSTLELLISKSNA